MAKKFSEVWREKPARAEQTLATKLNTQGKVRFHNRAFYYENTPRQSILSQKAGKKEDYIRWKGCLSLAASQGLGDVSDSF